MSPLQTEAMNVQNYFISRHTPKVYNPSLFVSLFLYHPHHPRNKDICQADTITIFANICYRPISVLLLLSFSFCMYEPALISPRKVNAWINVSGLNGAERMKHMYERARVVFVHPGLCWAPPVPWDTVWRPRPPWQKYADWPEEETGRLSIQGNTNFLENQVWREADWGCQSHLLCCHTGTMGKDGQTAALSSQRLTQSKQKKEGDGGQSIWKQKTWRHGGCEVSVQGKGLLPRSTCLQKTECPSW